MCYVILGEHANTASNGSGGGGEGCGCGMTGFLHKYPHRFFANLQVVCGQFETSTLNCIKLNFMLVRVVYSELQVISTYIVRI